MFFPRERRAVDVVAWLLLYLTLCLTSRANAARIVAFTPQQGDWMAAGAEMRNGYSVALQRLAETGRPTVTVEFRDCSGNADSLRNEVLELADSDCLGILGGYPSRAAETIAISANLIGIPYLIDCASADTLSQIEREYVFRLFPPTSDINDGIVAWACEVGGRGRRTAILCDTTSFRTSVNDLTKDLAVRWDGDVLTFPFRHGCVDFTETLDKVEKQHPAIVWLFGTLSENGAILRQAKARDWNPYAFILGSQEMVNRRLISYSDGAADYAIGPIVWSPGMLNPVVVEFVKRYNEKTGEDPSARTAYSYTGLIIFSNAVAKASLEKRDLIKKALAETHATSVIGDVRFESYRTYYQQNRPVTYAAQVIDKSWEVVYPVDNASADDVYPVPTWRDRNRDIQSRYEKDHRMLALGAASLLTIALIVSKGITSRKSDS